MQLRGEFLLVVILSVYVSRFCSCAAMETSETVDFRHNHNERSRLYGCRIRLKKKCRKKEIGDIKGLVDGWMDV